MELRLIYTRLRRFNLAAVCGNASAYALQTLCKPYEHF